MAVVGPTGGRGGGRGLFAGRPLRAGEVALQEMPLLAWPAEAFAGVCCAGCLRLCAPGTAMACPGGCGAAVFCSETCWLNSGGHDKLHHPPGVCRGLKMLRESAASVEERDAARFLLLAYNAKLYHSAAFQQLWGLVAAGQHAQQVRLQSLVELVHAALGPQATASVGEATALLARDGANGFAIMGPRKEDGERQARGFAIYPALAMTNHECLPNCVRYDDFDGTDRTGLFPHSQAPPNNMLLQLRTLHALPQGEELLLAYFPLDWDLEERRERLAQDYGFECTCGRCRLEASWESNEPVTGAVGGSEVTEDYLGAFCLKYICPDDDCGGTMGPLDGSDVCACNCCGFCRSEAEFQASLNE